MPKTESKSFLKNLSDILDNLIEYHRESKSLGTQHYALFFERGVIKWWEKVGYSD